MSICNRTHTSTESAAQIIAEAMARFTGRIEIVPGVPETPPPKRRSDWIDPDSKLLRRKAKKDQRSVMTEEKLANIRAAQRKGVELRKDPNAEPSMAEMARRYGLHKSLVWRRVKQQGMTIEQAVTTPVNDRNQRFRR
jgi:hypothetical protein